jgi:serine/threonine protein kinase
MNHGPPMTTGGPGPHAERILGRYALFDEIASGGMATVHLGRMLGPVGFSKTVAIKRLHPHLARDPEFVSMFLDEARLAARIQHPNVVATLDVVASDGEVFLVLDYVQGESFSHLLKATRIKGVPTQLRVISSVVGNALHGLHAAHEAQDEHGRPLGLVHRDVSPQNILVGVDGVARVLDFGVAKAAGRLQSTRDGQLKGKLAYMAPEQIRGDEVDRRTDIYAAAVVLWEGFAGRRLIHGMNEGQVLAAVLAGGFPPPSSLNPHLPPEADAIVMRGLSMHPDGRWSSAREMAIALERAVGVASPYEVAEWVQSVGAEAIAMRAARVREMESTSAVRVSLHDAGGPQIFHEGPQARYDASRSGVSVVTSPSISAVMQPVPPAPAENTGSVYVHPALQAPQPPPYPGPAPMQTGSGMAPVPAAPAPASRAKVILISVAVSAVFGISVIVLLLWLRTRNQPPPESSIESVPSPAGSVKTPEPAATVTAAPPPIVDIPNEPAQPEPSASAEEPVAESTKQGTTSATKTSGATTTKTGGTSATKTGSAGTTKTGSSSGGTKAPKGCESPFFVDANGIKQIKPECM